VLDELIIRGDCEHERIISAIKRKMNDDLTELAVRYKRYKGEHLLDYLYEDDVRLFSLCGTSTTDHARIHAFITDD